MCMFRSAALVAVIAAPVASADLVYQTQFQLQADGSFVAVSAPDAQAYGQFLSEAFTLFRGYRVYNKRKFAEAALEQREQELGTTTGSDGTSFSSVGDEVTFNPLATGGTVDISTGGDFIDTDLASQFILFEIAQVDVENNKFTQEFGQMKITRRDALTLPGESTQLESYLIQWGGGLPWETPLLAVDGSGLTQMLEVRMSVVPAPSAAVALGVGVLAIRRRR